MFGFTPIKKLVYVVPALHWKGVARKKMPNKLLMSVLVCRVMLISVVIVVWSDVPGKGVVSTLVV